MPVRITSSTAVVSMVFGILCWVALPFVGAIVAVVCGHVARGEIRRAPPDSIDGDGMALTGLILGYAQIAFVLLVIATVVGLFGEFAYHH